jgi:hypothetical protein
MKVDSARRKLIQLLRSPDPLAGRRGELTLAIWTWWNVYKQRNGKRFPIITKYDQDRDIFFFPEFNPFFPEQNIPDAWKKTREIRMV